MKKETNNEKIDFVIIWVDGNDPKWQKEKAKYSPNKNTDSRNIRYRDWENLKYWFRGVEKFAPWVNKIYFVTCGHYPEWLNKDNPKLVCVQHSDYMPKEYLPTFSANPIELNLHRIKGLSEQFVYFNDDMFICKKVKKEDFFKNKKPCDMAVFNPITGVDETFVSLEQNVNLIINRHFKKNSIVKKNLNKYLNIRYGKYNMRTFFCLPFSRIQGFYEAHSCNPFLKSTFNEVWDKEFETLDETSKRKFRSTQDVNQYIFKYWQFCKGNFKPKYNKRKSIRIFDNLDKACNIIKKRKYQIVCLNDSNSSEEEFNIAKKKIIECLERILPEKSSFEK
mgnify:CR=1 FL=1